MTLERYSRGAIVLHWAIALLLAFELGMGWHMVTMPEGSAMFAAFQLHKSIGILVLLLSFARLALRFARPAPAPVPAGRSGALLARGVHVLLYVVMIAGPLTGWAAVSTARIVVPTRLFGIVPLPHLPLERVWNGLATAAHAQIAWLGVGLFALHVAGAIRHHLGPAPQDVLGRMMPELPGTRWPELGRSLTVAGIAVVLLLLCFAAPWLGGPRGSAPVQASARTSATAEFAPASSAVPIAEPRAPATTLEVKTGEAKAAGENPSTAVPARWTMLPGGRLAFTVSMNGTPIAGRMVRWSGDILFDPDALEKSRVVVRIPLLSADTGDATRDEMLRGEDFFGLAGGEAVYRSDSIVRTGRDRYRAEGSLTMNGRSRRVPLSFTLRIADDIAMVTGVARLDRLAFGIGRGQWAVADQIAADVAIDFSLKARREASEDDQGRKGR